MLSNPLCANYIYQINNLIHDTKDYVDSNFWFKDPIYQSDKDYYSKLWEMIMIGYFLKKGARVVKTKDKNLGSKNGNPDIKIELEDGKVLWVECVVAKIGNISIEKFNQGNYCGSTEELYRAKIVRLSNSIDYKNKKLNEYLENATIEEGDFYIIAVNPCEYLDSNESTCLERILYGKGDGVIEYEQINGKLKEVGFYYNRNLVIDKIDNDGKLIPIKTDLFLNTSWKKASLIGVLYSGFNGINSIERGSYTIGFDNNFKKYEKYIAHLFDRYSYLENYELMQKL